MGDAARILASVAAILALCVVAALVIDAESVTILLP